MKQIAQVLHNAVVENERVIVVALMACVLLGGILYGLSLGGDLRYPDEHEYVTIARNLLAGHGYSLDGRQPTAYRPPGFPFFIAAGLALDGDIVTVRMLNIACLLLSLICLFRLGRRAGGPGAGLAAVLVALGYPVLVYTAGTLYPQTLTSCLLLMVLVALFDAETLTLWRIAVAGMLCGILILTSPSFIFLLAFLVAWIPVTGRLRWDVLLKTATLIVVAALVLLPWHVRNQRTFGRFFFVSTNGGINLLLGNCEKTTPNAGVNIDLSKYGAPELDEVERDAHYRRAAFQYMKTHPARTLGMYGLKFLNYFNYRNKLYVATEGSSWRDLVMLLTYGGVLGLAVLRLVAARRVPLSRLEQFVFSFYVANGAFAAIFFTRIRFRVPLDFMLASASGVTLILVLRAIAGVATAGGAGTRSTDS